MTEVYKIFVRHNSCVGFHKGCRVGRAYRVQGMITCSKC